MARKPRPGSEIEERPEPIKRDLKPRDFDYREDPNRPKTKLDLEKARHDKIMLEKMKGPKTGVMKEKLNQPKSFGEQLAGKLPKTKRTMQDIELSIGDESVDLGKIAKLETDFRGSPLDEAVVGAGKIVKRTGKDIKKGVGQIASAVSGLYQRFKNPPMGNSSKNKAYTEGE
jgi:hypothetical protein